MSLFKRIGNVVKGSLRTAGRDESSYLSEAALQEELARVTPGQEARDRLATARAGRRWWSTA